MARADCTVLVYTKPPVYGIAMTRLRPHLPAAELVALQTAFIERTLTTAVESRLGPVSLHGYPSTDHPFFVECGRRFQIALATQHGNDLGERMANGLDSAVREHSRAILVGTDCPGLNPDILRRAAATLDGSRDAVFIPAEDGGFVLAGLARPAETLFSNMPWGGDEVMDRIRGRMRERHWRWAELAPLWDVDRVEDYRRWRREHALR